MLKPLENKNPPKHDAGFFQASAMCVGFARGERRWRSGDKNYKSCWEMSEEDEEDEEEEEIERVQIHSKLTS